jgi:tripartite-type tricarboxylate transporter receptor subunit TctC
MRKPGLSVMAYFAAIAVCTNLPVSDSLAQGYPVKPVRMLVGLTAGSASDVAARLTATILSENLGQPVVVENRPGAGGSIATESVAKSPADGYTLLMMAAGDTVQPALRARLAYDLVHDFAPVTLVATGTTVLSVHPSVPARNVKELIALARSQPGKLHYGSPGVGSSAHLMGELFNLLGKVTIVHVPFRGAAESSVANASGQIEMNFPSLASAAPLLAAGRIKALAVTGAKRSSLIPQIPTIDESGLSGYDRKSWYGVIAPAGLSRDIVTRLNTVIRMGIGAPQMKKSFFAQGIEPQTNTPEQFASLIRLEIARNIELITLTGAKAD